MIKNDLLPRTNAGVNLAAIVASAALYYFSTGLHGIGTLVFLAPFPILVLALRSSLKMTVMAAFVAFAVGALNMTPYLSRLAPLNVVLASIFIPAMAFVVAVLLTRAAVLHGSLWLGVIVFPSSWTTYEYLLSMWSPHGTAGSIAYTQVDFLPLLQIVSWTGIWGITFIASIIPAGLAIAWHAGDHRRQAAAALAIPTVLAVGVLSFGSLRLMGQQTEWPITVGLAACDTSLQYFQTTGDSVAIPVVEAYTRRVAELALEGAQIVVLPEKFVGVTQRYDTTILRMFLEAAHENRVYILAGFNDIKPIHNVNAAILFSPLDYATMIEYEKKYLIPGLESKYRPGTMPRLFRIRQVDAGIEICKDLDFPDWSREYGKRNARIVFVPAWDFGDDGALHSRMAVVRGVENGFAVARCAQEGLLTVSDYAGRIIAEESSSSSPEVLLIGAVPPGPGSTFYSTHGDWFARLNLFFICLFAPSLIIYVSRRALKRFQAHS